MTRLPLIALAGLAACVVPPNDPYAQSGLYAVPASQSAEAGAAGDPADGCTAVCNRVAACGQIQPGQVAQCTQECAQLGADPSQLDAVARMDCASLAQAMGGGGAAPAAAAPGTAPAAAPVAATCQSPRERADARMYQMVTSGPWCSWSYNANTGYSSSCKVVLRADGSGARQCGGEGGGSGQSKNQYGEVVSSYSYASQGSGGGEPFCWRLEGTQLAFGDGRNYQVAPTSVEDNGYGVLFVKVNGAEFKRCN